MDTRKGAAVLMLVTSLAVARQVGAGPSHGNAVTHWNAVAGEVFTPTQGTDPLAQSRTLAIMHAAIHDVLNAIERRFGSYTPGLAAAPGASADAAVATAAREVLIALVPEQTAMVDAEYERALTSVPDGPSKADGIGLESATKPLYVPRPGPGEYQFTEPFDFANLPGWGRVRPFVIDMQPFLITPPVPDYPSTHTVLGAAAAEVLIALFGDHVRYSATSLTLPGVTRQFKGFSEAARENGLSRVYAGIHFQHAVKDGHRQGRSVGRAVARSLEPVR